MEPNFQTSFIPKKPIVKESSISARPVGSIFIISLLVFLTMLVATGGLYFYRSILQKNIADMDKTLNLAKSRFEPSKIAELKVLDKRLRASNEILNKHISVTPIFSALEALTMKSVRFTKFGYTVSDDGKNTVNVQMSGVAMGYKAVALQADLFGTNKNLINPVFSNLNLDNSGNVLFDLTFSVDPNFVNYKQTLQPQN